mmetsp:Transcript_6167/g.7485  ORF Transcript_6167/g.7485 Transcript_6167/m.7485 type:complete len:189 (+) Transcript_6167:2-568(+)
MIDEELNQKFGGLIKNENLKQSCSKFIITKRSRFSFSNRRKSHDRKMTNHNWPIWARMACIIVFDQVPRNVYRGDKRAYETDSIALNFALGFLRSGEINTLPFHFRATILIAMCHSETLQVQQELGEYISSHHFSAYETSYSLVSKALKDIQKNHEERIKQFERFPERNHILGRQSTQKEQAYLKELY